MRCSIRIDLIPSIHSLPGRGLPVWEATPTVRGDILDQAEKFGVVFKSITVHLPDFVADRGILVIREVHRDHLVHDGQAYFIGLSVDRRQQVLLVGTDVPLGL